MKRGKLSCDQLRIYKQSRHCICNYFCSVPPIKFPFNRIETKWIEIYDKVAQG